MTAQIEAIRRCSRVFTNRNTEAELEHTTKVARHGHFCDRCFYRCDKSLRMQGPLVEHILHQVGGLQSKNPDGSQRLKGDPPLPFNVEAFNDANEIYSQLVYLCAVFATKLNRQAPAPAARAWRTDNNRVVGLPADIDPAAARYAVAIMGIWLSAHLEDIAALNAIDDVSYLMDAMEDVHRINAKWPSEDQAIYAPVQCPDDSCKGKIALHPPKFEGDDQKIICETCGRVFTEDDYDRMASVFRQVRTEQAKEIIKAHKTAERLAKRYGGAA